MNPYSFILISLCVLAVVLFFVLQYEKERREALQKTARMMGFQYSPTGDLGSLGPAAELHLFKHGHRKRIKNVVHRPSEKLTDTVFDYWYTTGGGKSQHIHKQTVCLFRSDRLRLPEFRLHPKHMFHKIGQVLGYKDVNLDHSPNFSEIYFLRGMDEIQIKKMFSQDVTSVFMQKPGFRVEGRENLLLVYRSGRRIKPAELTAWMDSARILLRLFEQRSSSL
jgi:carbonic anhydrase